MKRKQNEVAQVAQALKNFFDAVSFFFSFLRLKSWTHI